MAKFIIEVSDGYIHERADIEGIVERNKDDVARGMIECLAFANLERRIDNGETEFVVRSKDFIDADETPRSALNSLVLQLASVCILNEVILEKKEK